MMFALALRDCFVHFFKSGARRVGEYGIFFESFSLCLFCQRKAANEFCYLNLYIKVN